MGEKRSWVEWITGRKKPAAPVAPPRRSQETLGGGHRGIAAGSLAPGTQDLSAENVAQWEQLPASEVEAFVYHGKALLVHSTNVAGLRYDFPGQKLVVAFKGHRGKPGKAYEYSDVTEDEAIRFAKASSKGGACWDYLRIRGTSRGHKKKYREVSW